MPVRSKAQSRYLNAKYGHDWVRKHHYGGTTKDLPEHAQHGKSNVGLALYRSMQAQRKTKKG